MVDYIIIPYEDLELYGSVRVTRPTDINAEFSAENGIVCRTIPDHSVLSCILLQNVSRTVLCLIKHVS